jgi:hypothetical protein
VEGCGGDAWSGSGSGASGCPGFPAGAVCSWGGSAQNQLPGGHELALGADCAPAVAGIPSASASKVEDRKAFVMAQCLQGAATARGTCRLCNPDATKAWAAFRGKSMGPGC